MSPWLTMLVEFLDLAFHDFRASRIQLQTVSCYTRIVLAPIQTLCPTATPFVSTLGAQGDLSYPLFGLSLTQNTTGSLAIGAIDSSVVKNVSKIVWNEVVHLHHLIQRTMYRVTYNGQFVLRASQYGVSCSTEIQFSIFEQVNGAVVTPIPTYPNATHNSSLALLDV